MPDVQLRSDSIPTRSDVLLPPPFGCSWETGGVHAAWIQVTGELDIATTPTLERTLRDSWAQARLVVLDLHELAFIDTSGTRVITDASIRARRSGRRLVVLGAPAHVNRMFTVTGSFRDLEIVDFDPVLSRVEVLVQLAGADRAS